MAVEGNNIESTTKNQTSDLQQQDNDSGTLSERMVTELDTTPVINSFIQYNFIREHWEACAERAHALIEEHLKEARDVTGKDLRAKVIHRAKTERSLEEKLKMRNFQRESNGRKGYETMQDILEDVKDLAGVRVLLYTPDTAQRLKVRLIIKEIWGPNVEESAHRDSVSSTAVAVRGDLQDKAVQNYIDYQVDNYHVMMKKSHRNESYMWKLNDKVEIQVVSALGHAWAEARHDVLYKPHAYGLPSAGERQILDTLTGLITSGDILLEQFSASVARRTTAKWHQLEQFAMFLREVDVLEREVEGQGSETHASHWDDFSAEGKDILFRFLVRIEKNFPLAVRNTIKDLGYPQDPTPGLENELNRYRPVIKPPHGLLTPFCIISKMLRGVVLIRELLAIDYTTSEKCSMMMDTLMLLQMFSGGPAAAESFLSQLVLTYSEEESMKYMVASPYREYCLKGTGNTTLMNRIEREMQPAWDWFLKQSRDSASVCGLLFQLASMGIPANVLNAHEGLRILEISPLDQVDTLEDLDSEPHTTTVTKDIVESISRDPSSVDTTVANLYTQVVGSTYTDNVLADQVPDSAALWTVEGEAGHLDDRLDELPSPSTFGKSLVSDRSTTSGDVSLEHTAFSFDNEGSSFAGTSHIELSKRLHEPGKVSIMNENREAFDYLSIASNDEEIASQVSRRMAEPELLAVKLFGAFFAEVDDLRILHRELLDELGTARFIVNYRRALKNYVLKLKEDAHTALEKDTIKVLEHRKNRQTMALQIMDYIIPEDDDDRTRWNNLPDQALQKQLLEDWAKMTYGPPDLAPAAIDVFDEISEDESERPAQTFEKNQLETLTTTNIGKTLNFLQKPAPLRALTLQLRLLSLPTSLREILDTTPKCDLEIVDEANDSSASIVNRCKAWVESYTLSHWDWWPLKPCIPSFIGENALLKWKVSASFTVAYVSTKLAKLCGVPLYVRLPLKKAETIKHLLHTMDEHPSKCHCCTAQMTRMKWTTAFKHIYQFCRTFSPLQLSKPSLGSVSLSIAENRYNPSSINAAGSLVSPPQISSPGSRPGPPSNAGVGAQGHGFTPDTVPPVSTLSVVFGIKDMQGFHDIEHIDTYAQLTDSSFFQDLKESHKRHRWHMQNWFSPYVFRYCRFVQVSTAAMAFFYDLIKAVRGDS
jgi:ppGpp synthetase/RelA/SpoT-type nucleotidyltranferase